MPFEETFTLTQGQAKTRPVEIEDEDGNAAAIGGWVGDGAIRDRRGGNILGLLVVEIEITTKEVDGQAVPVAIARSILTESVSVGIEPPSSGELFWEARIWDPANKDRTAEVYHEALVKYLDATAPIGN